MTYESEGFMTFFNKRRVVALVASVAAAGAVAVVGPASSAHASGSYHRVYANSATCIALMGGDIVRLQQGGFEVTYAECIPWPNGLRTDGYLKWKRVVKPGVS